MTFASLRGLQRVTEPPGMPVLLAILLVGAALAVRLAGWAYWGSGTIESEGAEYAKIAENLRTGMGYVGFVVPGPQVNFPPLFPWLIAGASLLTGDYELAGRLVTLVIGALLPLPVYGVASRLFNRRVGFIAAMLVLLHPLLVHLSYMVYAEGPYPTLLMTAIYFVVRALETSSSKWWMAAGGMLALCYLLRAEALAALAIAVLFALAATTGDLTARLKLAAATVAVFLVLALPQVIFLFDATGKVMLEGKSTVLFSYTGGRILAAKNHPGVPYVSAGGRQDIPSPAPGSGDGGGYSSWEEAWAFYAIGSDLKPTGTSMRPFAEVARETRPRLDDSVRLVVQGVRQSAPNLPHMLSSTWLGAPFLTAIALLGVFRRPWRGPRAKARLFLMLVTVAPVIATFFVLWADARYFFIFVPLLSIWAANGLFEIGRWTRATCAAAGWNALASPLVAEGIVPVLLGIVLVVSPFKAAATQWDFTDSGPAYRVDREVGLWLKRQQAGPIRIMDLSLPLSYHAGAQMHYYFPYASEQAALGYLASVNVDYIVLREGFKFTHYYEDWLAHGIPDRRAELIQPPAIPGAEKFRIYRWHRNDAGEVARTSLRASADAQSSRGAPTISAAAPARIGPIGSPQS
jgi:4-amino-4-deoxy-L-arabinose transferase-like glycosyltransferase